MFSVTLMQLLILKKIYNGTIPTCGFQLSKKALWQTQSRISNPVVFGISLATL